MMTPSFIFDASKGQSPASVARQRAIAEALMASSRGAPHNVGEGLSSLGQGIAAALYNYRADKGEAAGQAGSKDLWASKTGGVDPVTAALVERHAPADSASTASEYGSPAAPVSSPIDAPDIPPDGAALPKIGGPDEPMPDGAAVQTADAGAGGIENLGVSDLMELANDPWASDTKKQIVGELLKQKLKQPDPNDALQAEKLRLEIDKMKNPDGTEYLTRQKQAERLGMTPGDPRYQPFILTGNIPANSGAEDKYGERKTAAEQLGLTPQDPAYQSFILTGKMPREDQAPLTAVDKKAILDSEDMAMAGKNTVDMLTSVLAETDGPGTSLNDRASYGATANTQAWLARNDPTGIMDDKTGEATTELQNVVLNQALGSLKAIFGAAPTEGERKILVDLQASVDKTPAERKIIINRAIEMAQRRQQFYTDRATEIRGETYYKPGGGAAGQNGVEPPPAVAPIGAAGGATALPDGVTEDDIQLTMAKHGLTRDQVLERLNNAP